MVNEYKPRVLIVDDEEQVTRGLSLLLRKDFDITTASSGMEALDFLGGADEFDVVMSDMRMPGMNGAQLLTRAREGWPETARVLLTGQADTESAIAAVNDGQIFRFVTKPCSPQAIRHVLDEATEYRKLRFAERDVLQNTLREAVLVLSEVLGTVHPRLTLRCDRIRSVITSIGATLELEDLWQYELAAALSHLGCIPLPARIVNAVIAGEALVKWDEEAWASHPAFGAGLISSIQRMETIADMIRNQRQPAPAELMAIDRKEWPPDILGSELLRAVNFYLQGTTLGQDASKALAAMTKARSFPAWVIDALATVPRLESEGVERVIRASQLRSGMTLVDDLTSPGGVVLACAGAVVSNTLVRLALNFSARGELREPFRIQAELS